MDLKQYLFSETETGGLEGMSETALLHKRRIVGSSEKKQKDLFLNITPPFKACFHQLK